MTYHWSNWLLVLDHRGLTNLQSCEDVLRTIFECFYGWTNSNAVSKMGQDWFPTSKTRLGGGDNQPETYTSSVQPYLRSISGGGWFGGEFNLKKYLEEKGWNTYLDESSKLNTWFENHLALVVCRLPYFRQLGFICVVHMCKKKAMFHSKRYQSFHINKYVLKNYKSTSYSQWDQSFKIFTSHHKACHQLLAQMNPGWNDDSSVWGSQMQYRDAHICILLDT